MIEIEVENCSKLHVPLKSGSLSPSQNFAVCGSGSLGIDNKLTSATKMPPEMSPFHSDVLMNSTCVEENDVEDEHCFQHQINARSGDAFVTSITPNLEGESATFRSDEELNKSMLLLPKEDIQSVRRHNTDTLQPSLEACNECTDQVMSSKVTTVERHGLLYVDVKSASASQVPTEFSIDADVTNSNLMDQNVNEVHLRDDPAVNLVSSITPYPLQAERRTTKSNGKVAKAAMSYLQKLVMKIQCEILPKTASSGIPLEASNLHDEHLPPKELMTGVNELYHTDSKLTSAIVPLTSAEPNVSTEGDALCVTNIRQRDQQCSENKYLSQKTRMVAHSEKGLLPGPVAKLSHKPSKLTISDTADHCLKGKQKVSGCYDKCKTKSSSKKLKRDVECEKTPLTGAMPFVFEAANDLCESLEGKLDNTSLIADKPASAVNQASELCKPTAVVQQITTEEQNILQDDNCFQNFREVNLSGMKGKDFEKSHPDNPLEKNCDVSKFLQTDVCLRDIEIVHNDQCDEGKSYQEFNHDTQLKKPLYIDLEPFMPQSLSDLCDPQWVWDQQQGNNTLLFAVKPASKTNQAFSNMQEIICEEQKLLQEDQCFSNCAKVDLSKTQPLRTCEEQNILQDENCFQNLREVNLCGMKGKDFEKSHSDNALAKNCDDSKFLQTDVCLRDIEIVHNDQCHEGKSYQELNHDTQLKKPLYIDLEPSMPQSLSDLCDPQRVWNQQQANISLFAGKPASKTNQEFSNMQKIKCEEQKLLQEDQCFSNCAKVGLSKTNKEKDSEKLQTGDPVPKVHARGEKYKQPDILHPCLSDKQASGHSMEHKNALLKQKLGSKVELSSQKLRKNEKLKNPCFADSVPEISETDDDICRLREQLRRIAEKHTSLLLARTSTTETKKAPELVELISGEQTTTCEEDSSLQAQHYVPNVLKISLPDIKGLKVEESRFGSPVGKVNHKFNRCVPPNSPLSSSKDGKPASDHSQQHFKIKLLSREIGNNVPPKKSHVVGSVSPTVDLSRPQQPLGQKAVGETLSLVVESKAKQAVELHDFTSSVQEITSVEQQLLKNDCNIPNLKESSFSMKERNSYRLSCSDLVPKVPTKSKSRDHLHPYLIGKKQASLEPSDQQNETMSLIQKFENKTELSQKSKKNKCKMDFSDSLPLMPQTSSDLCNSHIRLAPKLDSNAKRPSVVKEASALSKSSGQQNIPQGDYSVQNPGKFNLSDVKAKQMNTSNSLKGNSLMEKKLLTESLRKKQKMNGEKSVWPVPAHMSNSLSLMDHTKSSPHNQQQLVNSSSFAPGKSKNVAKEQSKVVEYIGGMSEIPHRKQNELKGSHLVKKRKVILLDVEEKQTVGFVEELSFNSLKNNISNSLKKKSKLDEKQSSESQLNDECVTETTLLAQNKERRMHMQPKKKKHVKKSRKKKFTSHMNLEVKQTKEDLYKSLVEGDEQLKLKNHFFHRGQGKLMYNEALLNCLIQMEQVNFRLEAHGTCKRFGAIVSNKFVNIIIDRNTVQGVEEVASTIVYYFSYSTFDSLQFLGEDVKKSLLIPVSEQYVVKCLFQVERRNKPHLQDFIPAILSMILGHFFWNSELHVFGLASLCRLYTAIHQELNFLPGPQVLCHDILLRYREKALYLITSVVGVWPKVLNFQNLFHGARNPLNLVMSFLLLNPDNRGSDLMIAENFKVLLALTDLNFHGISVLTAESLIKQLFADLAEHEEIGSLNEEQVTQYTKAIKLLCQWQSWEWIYETVILQGIYPFLDQWVQKHQGKQKNKHSKVIIGMFHLLVGVCHLVSACSLESVHSIISKVLTFLKGSTVPFAMQEAAFATLTSLKSYNKDIAVSALKAWEKKNAHLMSRDSQKELITFVTCAVAENDFLRHLTLNTCPYCLVSSWWDHYCVLKSVECTENI